MAPLDTKNFHEVLQTSHIGRKVVYSLLTGSTMDDARRLAHDVKEYPHGTIVMSEQQTKARGARYHKWDASKTGNIYMSIILHMPQSYKTFEGKFDLEVAACLAVLQVVWKFGVTEAKPKWPNDIWVRGHKLAGFLAEDGRFDIPGSTKSLFILGAGINVNADVHGNSELHSIATSMICERGGQCVNREKFLAEVCFYLEQTLSNTKETNLAMFMKENLFQENSDLVVSVNSCDRKFFDAKFLTICENWDVKLLDMQTGCMLQGSSQVYSIRPKIVNKILLVFIHDTSTAKNLSRWLSAVIDTSKYTICLVPESSIIATEEWMKSCSLLVLTEHTCNLDLMTRKVDQFLKSGGSMMTFGMGTVYLSNILHIPLTEAAREHCASPDIVLLHLLTETTLSPLSVFVSNSTHISNISVSDTVSACKEESDTAPSLHRYETILFPVCPIYFNFQETEAVSAFCAYDSSDPSLLNMAKESLCLVHVPDKTFISQSSVSSNLETRVTAYYANTSSQDKLLAVFTGNVSCGGHVALWGFNIVDVDGKGKNSLSAEELTALTEDRFKRDHFLFQVVQTLLKI